jgi:hypothetical protein
VAITATVQETVLGVLRRTRHPKLFVALIARMPTVRLCERPGLLLCAVVNPAMADT